MVIYPLLFFPSPRITGARVGRIPWRRAWDFPSRTRGHSRFPPDNGLLFTSNDAAPAPLSDSEPVTRFSRTTATSSFERPNCTSKPPQNRPTPRCVVPHSPERRRITSETSARGLLLGPHHERGVTFGELADIPMRRFNFLIFFYISSSCFDLRVSVFRDLRFPLVRLSGCRGSSSALRRLALQLQQTDLGRHSLVLVLLQRVQAAVQPLLRRRSRLPVFRLAAVIHLV